MNLYYASQSFYPYIGGVSTALLNLTKEMVNKGNRVIEVHLRPSGEHYKGEIQGIEVHRVPREPLNKMLMLGYSKFKEAIYQESHFKIHTPKRPVEAIEGFSEFNQVNHYFGEELRELLEKDPADIVHINDFQLLLTYQYIPRGTPLILSWHIPFISSMSASLKQFVIKYMNEYDAVVFSSEKYRKAALKAGLNAGKAEVIPPITNTNLFKIMEGDVSNIKNAYQIPSLAKIILCVQRIDSKSGHEQLVRSMPLVLKKNSGVRLVFVGGASLGNALSDERAQLEKKLKQLIRELGLEQKIIFTGNIPYEKLPALFNAASVVALCSKNEGFGLSITEAMACGKPVIGTRVGGIPLQIRDGKNGFLVEVNDYEATANRILKILSSPSLAKKMGGESVKIVHENFKLEQGVEKHLMLYRKVQRSKKLMHRIEYYNPSQFRAIITDLDRTLTNTPDKPQFHYNHYNQKLLNALQELGLDLLLATGRNFDYIKKLCHSFKIWRCVVCENGAVLYFPKTKKIMIINTPEMHRAKHIIRKMKRKGVTFGKIIVSAQLTDEIQIKKQLGHITQNLNFIKNVNEVMITPKGVDKGQGLRLAMQYLHIDMDRTIVVGDGENDVDMFLNPGFKIALENADNKLKKLANQVMKKPAIAGMFEIIEKLKA